MIGNRQSGVAQWPGTLMFLEDRSHLLLGCERLRKRHGRPGRSPRTDPLIVTIGKSAFKISLDFRRAARDMPGGIRLLRAQKKSHSPLIRRTGGRYACAD